MKKIILGILLVGTLASATEIKEKEGMKNSTKWWLAGGAVALGGVALASGGSSSSDSDDNDTPDAPVEAPSEQPQGEKPQDLYSNPVGTIREFKDGYILDSQGTGYVLRDGNVYDQQGNKLGDYTKQSDGTYKVTGGGGTGTIVLDGENVYVTGEKYSRLAETSRTSDKVVLGEGEQYTNEGVHNVGVMDTGILLHDGASATNDGVMTVKSGGTGMAVTNGSDTTITNNGTIVAKGVNATGIQNASNVGEDGTNNAVINNGNIVTSGVGSKGVHVSGEGNTVENNGVITATNGATAVKSENGGNVTNNGLIVADKNSKIIDRDNLPETKEELKKQYTNDGVVVKQVSGDKVIVADGRGEETEYKLVDNDDLVDNGEMLNDIENSMSQTVDTQNERLDKQFAMNQAQISAQTSALSELKKKGDIAVGVGIGGTGDDTAVSMAVATKPSENTNINANVTTTTDGEETTFGIGGGIKLGNFLK